MEYGFDPFDTLGAGDVYCPVHGCFELCQQCEYEQRERDRTAEENLWWISTQPVNGFTYEDEHGL